MIKSFKHKGLERFFYTGIQSGIQTNQAGRLRNRLAVIDAASSLEDIDKPGYRLHELKGSKKDLWAINVSKNWRLVFRFENGDAYILNYEDYH